MLPIFISAARSACADNIVINHLQGTFVPDEEELTPRPKGALQDSKVSLVTPGKFFGIKGLGFTKANELFAGRLAQLGFAASLIGEGLTGKGILGQLNVEVCNQHSTFSLQSVNLP